MPAPRRIAAALAAIAVAAAVAGNATAAAVAKPCAAATNGVYLDTDLAVAQRIAADERSGAAVSHALHTIASDRVLASAVARDDLAAIRSELIVLLYNHEHIVRISVLRGGVVIEDVGGANVLAPSSGTLRVGGREVGTFEFSIQDDLGYQLLAQRLVGADTVIRYQGQTVLEDVAAGSMALPLRGTVRIGGSAYLVATIRTGRFPTGTLHISLLVPVPVAALARQPCGAVRTDALGAIAEHVYNEAIAGPGVTVARKAIAAAGTLTAAVVAHDDAAVRRDAPALLANAHVSRLAVLIGDRVVADFGSSMPLVAPVPVALTDASGTDVGTVLISIQSVSGFYTVTSYLTGAFVLVRQGAQQLAGQRRGPASLPASGPLDYDGAHFDVFSFEGTRFPTGTLTIYLLVRV